MLPAISLGCWHNFGEPGTGAAGHRDEAAFHDNCRAMLRTAFDLGITHFDLANNYGPPPGAAEERVGRILKQDFSAHRDELVISTKAGYRMWPGPYGEWGSRKSLLASLDASLKRLGLDYVDIFYSHRPDPGTPFEETMGALDQAVRSGKAIYAGISSYSGAQTEAALAACEANRFVRPVIHQPSYNLLDRWIEGDLLPVTDRRGLGVIAFCPLAQGRLTAKYLRGVPDDSRAKTRGGFLKAEDLQPGLIAKVAKLDALAKRRGQSLAQMALRWVLRDQPHGPVTSALIGASRPEQIVENVKALDGPPLSESELEEIDAALV
jgi:L-glyceraldehyde 3-phosphate reductase